MTEKIAVLGAGSWGSTLATVLVENGHDVKLYTNIPAQADELNEKHTNEHYMPGFKYPEKLYATTDLEEAVDGADAILFVVPTKVIRLVAGQLKDILAKTNAIQYDLCKANIGILIDKFISIEKVLRPALEQNVKFSKSQFNRIF